MHRAIFTLITAAWLGIFSIGCSTPHYQPIFGDPQFQQAPPQGLRFLPVIDARYDLQSQLNLDRDVRQPFASLATSRGFKTELVNWARAEQIPRLPDGTESMTDQGMSSYFPAGNTPVVVIRVEETRDSSKGLGRGALAVVAAWVFEPSGKLLWMHRATGNSMFASLDPIVATLNFTIRNPPAEAVQICLDTLNSTLPIPKK